MVFSYFRTRLRYWGRPLRLREILRAGCSLGFSSISLGLCPASRNYTCWVFTALEFLKSPQSYKCPISTFHIDIIIYLIPCTHLRCSYGRAWHCLEWILLISTQHTLMELSVCAKTSARQVLPHRLSSSLTVRGS